MGLAPAGWRCHATHAPVREADRVFPRQAKDEAIILLR